MAIQIGRRDQSYQKEMIAEIKENTATTERKWEQHFNSF